MSKYDFSGLGWSIGKVMGGGVENWGFWRCRKNMACISKEENRFFFSLCTFFCCFFFPIFLIVCPSYFLGSFSERSLDRLRSLENFYLTAKIYVAWTALFSTMYRERRQMDKCFITYTFQVFCFTIRSPTLTIDSTKVACAITVVFCDVFFIVTASCSIYTWIAITRIGLNWNHQNIATCWNLS